jgi:hypothetical protein
VLHVSEEDIDEYSMGRLTGARLAALEKHLLVCESCQDRLALADSFRQGLRNEPNLPSQAPKWAWAVGLAAAATLMIFVAIKWQASIRPALPQAIVLLQATRGVEDHPVAVSPGQPISLTLDLTGLPPFAQYKLEIVDPAGRPVFQSSATPLGDKLQAPLNKGLPANTYFARVYAPSRELLREYALLVHP